MTARPVDARPAEAAALAALAVGGRMNLVRPVRSRLGGPGPIVEIEPWDDAWIVRHHCRDGSTVSTGGEPCPWGVVGDRLWVRERWGWPAWWEGIFAYHVTGVSLPFGRHWRPSRSMPRRAARTWLRIVGVGVGVRVRVDVWEWVITVEKEGV